MKAYPAYKKSGLSSLKIIPENWGIKKIKYLGELKSGSGFPDVEQGVLDAEIPFYKVSDMNLAENSVFMQAFTNTVSLETVNTLGAKIIETGSILFPKVGAAMLTNKRRIVTMPCCADNNVMALNPYANSFSKFLYYALLIKDFGVIANPGAVPSINASQVSEIQIAYPPLHEQQAIADFLDRKTAHIDTLIEKKQHQIKLLQEQRTVLINQAVTKGLDPGVPMKDTGIEWLEEIPSHWKVKRFKHCAIIKSGQVDPREEPYKSMTLIAPNHIERITGRLLDTQTAEEQGAESGKYLYQEGDVLYSKIRPELRKACLSIGIGLCSADMYPLTPTEDLLAEFLLYLLLSNSFSLYATERSMRVAMPKVNREALSEYSFAYPGLSEQQEILVYIKIQTEKIDRTIDKSTRKIELLQEYRTALISAAVTGKIDVREEVR